MLELLVRFLRWNMRLWYPVIRLLGRLTGREELAERFVQVSEENLENTLETLEGDDE